MSDILDNINIIESRRIRAEGEFKEVTDSDYIYIIKGVYKNQEIYIVCDTLNIEDIDGLEESMKLVLRRLTRYRNLNTRITLVYGSKTQKIVVSVYSPYDDYISFRIEGKKVFLSMFQNNYYAYKNDLKNIIKSVIDFCEKEGFEIGNPEVFQDVLTILNKTRKVVATEPTQEL